MSATDTSKNNIPAVETVASMVSEEEQMTTTTTNYTYVSQPLQQQQQQQQQQQPDYVLVDPEDDIEGLRLRSPQCQDQFLPTAVMMARMIMKRNHHNHNNQGEQDKENHPNHRPNNHQQQQQQQRARLSLFGVDPDITSSVIQRLYSAGASSMGKQPPRKIGTSAQGTGGVSDAASLFPDYDDDDDHQSTSSSLSSSIGGVFSMDFCGASSNVVNLLLAVGAETVAQTRDQMCQHYRNDPEGVPPRNHYYEEYDGHNDDNVHENENVDGDSVSESSSVKRQKNLRVLEIAEDFRTVAPHSIQRKNLIRMVQESKQRNKKSKAAAADATATCTADTGTTGRPQKVAGLATHKSATKSTTPVAESASKASSNTEQYKIHHSSNDHQGGEEEVSEDYPSDLDEFLEYARRVVEEQNAPFDPASYREFESVLQQVVQVFGMDDDDDDDSMVSAHSYSGYDGDAPTHTQRHLEENPLISNASYQRVVGAIARKKGHLKKKNKTLDSIISGTVTKKEAMNTKEEVSDPVAPLMILSDEESLTTCTNGDQESSQDETGTLDSSFTQAVREGRAKLRPTNKNTISKPSGDSSVLDLFEMVTEQPTEKNSTPKPAGGPNETRFTISSSGNYNLSSKNRRIQRNDSSMDSESTITIGTSRTAIKKHLRHGNSTMIDKYKIDPLDNSLVSDTSFEPHQRIRKRRFRFRKTRNNVTDVASVGDDLFDNSEPRAVVGFERTVDDLAFLLKQGSHYDQGQEGPQDSSSSGIDRVALLEKLQQVAPELHHAVVARMESAYKNGVDRNEDSTSPGPRPADDRGRESYPTTVATKGTIGMSSPSTRPPTRPIDYNTPDKAYWADHSRDYDSSESPGLNRGADRKVEKPFVPKPFVARATKPEGLPLSAVNKISARSKAVEVPVLNANEMRSTKLDDIVPLVDDSRGSFWSEVLDVFEDDQPSDEVPSISVDDTSYSFTKDLLRIASTRQADGSYLDDMIDNFLTHRVENLGTLVEERKLIMARKEKVFEELKSLPYTLKHRRAGWATGESGSPYVQRGRALIRKIQRKRQALTLARQRQEQAKLEARILFSDQGGSSSSPCSTSPSSSKAGSDQKQEPGEYARDVSTKGNESQEEVRLEEFLAGSMNMKQPSASSPSSTSISETSKDAMRRMKERRLKLRLGRSTLPSHKKALHEAMDSALDSEDTAPTKPTASTRFIAPPKQPTIPSLRKPAKKECSYEALPEQNSSFCSSEMESGDILQALAPPSPSSPIRDYNQAGNHMNGAACDIEGLRAVASGDLSGDSGRMLLFTSDTEKSEGSINYVESVALGDDSFDGIITRSMKKSETTTKKNSPTSIADFNSNQDEFGFSKSNGVQEPSSGMLDETDEFLHTAMDLSMLQNNDDSGFEPGQFLGIDFQFPTRFSV